ncbi:hypothetical protein [Caenibius sp. WL]|uniref:hypothetical protein n=1 Tax=Caenibius sp. WL TaxID=2872646 RepID=UPI001C9903D8|nr:hypothetical protein [Caenibius sp. WL]QZP08525.1 hypothetical protein K5X80_01495 [Caenibius sp. WL]
MDAEGSWLIAEASFVDAAAVVARCRVSRFRGARLLLADDMSYMVADHLETLGFTTLPRSVPNRYKVWFVNSQIDMGASRRETGSPLACRSANI